MRICEKTDIRNVVSYAFVSIAVDGELREGREFLPMLSQQLAFSGFAFRAFGSRRLRYESL